MINSRKELESHTKMLADVMATHFYGYDVDRYHQEILRTIDIMLSSVQHSFEQTIIIQEVVRMLSSDIAHVVLCLFSLRHHPILLSHQSFFRHQLGEFSCSKGGDPLIATILIRYITSIEHRIPYYNIFHEEDANRVNSMVQILSGWNTYSLYRFKQYMEDSAQDVTFNHMLWLEFSSMQDYYYEQRTVECIPYFEQGFTIALKMISSNIPLNEWIARETNKGEASERFVYDDLTIVTDREGFLIFILSAFLFHYVRYLLNQSYTGTFKEDILYLHDKIQQLNRLIYHEGVVL